MRKGFPTGQPKQVAHRLLACGMNGWTRIRAKIQSFFQKFQPAWKDSEIRFLHACVWTPASLRRKLVNLDMLDEQQFRRASERAIDALQKRLNSSQKEGDAGFELAEHSGALHVLFKEQGGKFVVAPNLSARQIWISALATSFRLDWDAAAREFILPRTGEALSPLVERLVEECVQG
jgi:iron donor protein CyaY